MKTRIWLAMLMFLPAMGGLAQADTITVCWDGSGDYTTIQAGIDAAVNGDEVVVCEGTYTGPGNRDIDFFGKAVTVRSTDPCDPSVVVATTINCQASGRGFIFNSGEGPNSVLAGLTITNGKVDSNESSGGGGIYCENSSPTISYCIITGNSVGQLNHGGGGVFCTGSSPTISCCTITDNSSAGLTSGGGIYCRSGSNPTVTYCIIMDNSAFSGGGIASRESIPTINTCIIAGNSANNDGGGIFLILTDADLTVNHCTITNNSAGDKGGGIYSGNNVSLEINHCIVWGNSCVYDNPEIRGYNLAILHSDVRGSFPGVGNIDADPRFINSAGRDYHLSAVSPCINTGDPNHTGIGEVDIDGEPRIINVRIDIGADEFNYIGPVIDISPKQFLFEGNEGSPNPQAQILSISNLGSGTMSWEVTEDCPWLVVDPNSGDWTVGTDEINVYVDISGMGWGTYNCMLTVSNDEAVNSPRTATATLRIYDDFPGALHVPMEYSTIQAAIDDSNDGDIVIVGDGIYTGDGNRDISFRGKAITVRSENGPSNCIIDCQGGPGDSHRGFIFDSGEGPDSVLCGFTITGGFVTDSAWGGGGVLCISGGERVSPKITNCVFRDNSAILGGGGLCYAYLSSPEIVNCTFHNNSVELGLGGAVDGRSFFEAEMSNCIIWGNTPSDDPGISVQSVPYSEGCGPYPITVNFSLLQNDPQSHPYMSQYIKGYGNIVVDSCFVDAADGDYHLKSAGWRWDTQRQVWTWDEVTSPCIDTGNPGSDLGDELLSVPDDPDNEWGENLRINMGAYGGTAQASMAPAGWALLADLNNDGVITLVDFAAQMKDWLMTGDEQPGDLNRDGVVNGIDLMILVEDWLKRKPFVVTITKPEDGAEFYDYETVEIEADAWSVGGSVVKVEFFANEIKIGEDNDGSDGWKTNWQGDCGVNNLTAKATNDNGATAISLAVAITVFCGP